MTIDSKIIDHVKTVLRKFGPKYVTETGSFRSQVIINDLNAYDPQLISALLSDDLINQNYSETISNNKIFRLNDFIELFEYKEFWTDSYTKYSNRIGLTTANKFIEDSTDVVLDFPYKDAVLKAGMTKEDTSDGNEPFLNETLARPEINELFEPKVLVNAKKYDKDGVHPASSYSYQDNLIIKGNNLIALHSLSKKYAGKVKLIYIDPPYNTGSDSFEYNDRFSRSAWLTFIKNRVDIAKELLAEDGVLLVQTSFHQFPYLRVLLDNMFSQKGKHVFDMNILVRHPERTLTADKPFNDVMEYTLIYSNNPDYRMPRNLVKKTPDKYTYKVATTGKPDKVLNLGGKAVEVYYPEHTEIKKVEPSAENLHRETIRGSIREKNSSGRFYVAYLEKLRDQYPNRTIFKVPDMGDDSLGYRYFELPKSDKVKNGAYYQGMPTSTEFTKKPYANFLNMVEAYNNVNKQGVFSFRNGKKPEQLIKKYIDIFTKPGDIVLDFFMGSATTQATAMKMNRRFIGIEQMDYINTISVPRLQKVIEGEQDGISKEVNWSGGGSFVYAELMEKNAKYVDDINRAQNTEDLSKVYQLMKENADLDFRVDLNKYEQDKEREKWPLEQQKNLLLKILDKNQLYYNETNIDDQNIRKLISDSDYKFNKSFYGEKQDNETATE